MDRQSEKKGIRATLFSGRIGSFLLIGLTVALFVLLINSAIVAFAGGRTAAVEREELQTRIDAMEARLDGETGRIIKNLDPDYRRAVYEKSRGILAPGEELLPIYDEENE